MNKSKNELREWLETIAIAVVLAILIKAFLFDLIQVDGNSMMPTLANHERLIVYKAGYLIHKPKAGDIVVFRYPHEPKYNFIKRVIAVEGNTVEITDGRVFVDNVPLDEPYILEVTLGDFHKRIVPENTIFVLGDNRNNSKDSRFEDVGFVPVYHVKGRALLKIWPLSKIQ
ncbi:signal peptidase I [Geosporobacter ferrireducens]|uniref:Signal peptidase I n=1 Tax=Geosporobacter ferrireducens TaxID=1424294 RepID=A0A1D8GBT5_9FIRM|nr:signal peptidase I [Geosporobacter ferrireducens]AOT68381.1 signal peptidase I [Geosporobacter ferrireducens]MTI53829.1 signal peptidase I [Geosporobacter ferrireducens]